MREIIGNLQDLGISDYANQDITFTLTDRLGQPISVQSVSTTYTDQSSFTTTTDDYGYFTINLFKTTNTNAEVYYKVKIDSSTTIFNITVPDGDNPINIICLTNRIDYDGILKIFDTLDDHEYIFDDKFISKLDSYLKDNKIYLPHNERRMIDKFMSIADIPVENRCDDVAALDQYLSTLGLAK